MYVEWDPFRRKWCVKIKALLFISITLFESVSEDAAYDYVYERGLKPHWENWRNAKDPADTQSTKL